MDDKTPSSGALPALSQSRFLRFLAFGALYLAQGVPSGFITVGYVLFLTDQGLNNEAIGSAIGLISLPWAFKIVWALLIDRLPSTRFGRRRPFIIAAELVMGATLLLLLLLDPKRDLSLIGAVLVVHSTFAALQDASVDAMAVDLLQKKEQATANGVMWASKAVGVGIGGAGGAIFAKYFGWSTLVVTITAVLWGIMLLMILLRERPRAEVVEVARTHERLTWGELRRSFAFATPIAGVVAAMLTPAGFLLISVVYIRMLRAELGLSEEAIGTLQGVAEPIASILGALAGGVLADRLGVRKVVAGSMVCIGMAAAVFALAPGLRSSFTFLIAWSMTGQFFVGSYSASIMGLFMRLTNPAIGATQISIFMGGINLTAAWAAPLGGRIADLYGVSAAFAVTAVLQVACAGLLLFCDPRVAEARFRAAPRAAGPGDGALPPTQEPEYRTAG